MFGKFCLILLKEIEEGKIIIRNSNISDYLTIFFI